MDDRTMDYRTLGRSGLKVSKLCLGTMMFGGPTDEPTSHRIIARAREAGVNFLDTADVYNEGKSEEVTGRAIAGERDKWVVATKVCNPMGPGPNERGLSRKWVMQAADASLRRLGTDYIDIYYLHKEDHSVPLSETVRAMGDLVKAGKIRYFGVSNHRSWRVAEICRLCDELGIDRPVVSQPYYNAMNRMPEVEHLPACAFYGLGVVPYSPLARGVLTGKYDPSRPRRKEPAPDARTPACCRRNGARILDIAQEIKRYAQAKGATPNHLAVAWVLNSRTVTAVIGGPRTADQWNDYIAALAYKFTPDDEALIDRLVTPGHPSTPGYNDPAYPLEGRVTWTGA